MTTTTYDKDLGIATLAQAIDEIKRVISEKKGDITVKVAVRAKTPDASSTISHSILSHAPSPKSMTRNSLHSWTNTAARTRRCDAVVVLKEALYLHFITGV